LLSFAQYCKKPYPRSEYNGGTIKGNSKQGIKEGGRIMELEKNKAIARRFSQVWGTGDLKIVDELASPELTVRFPVFPDVIKGIAAFKETLTRLRSAFGNADIQIEEEIAEGDKVVLRWSFSGTHQAEFTPGIRPTGKRLKWTGISIYRIVDGKVVEERGEEDYLGILRQLGLIPKSQAQ
jgi:predicted ester cyclase